MLKRLLFLCAFALSVAVFSQSTYGMDILFEHRTEYQPSRGVTFERNRMMTANGMLDVHVLKVDMNAPYIEIAPVTSPRELGRRETTSSLLRDAGAVGGINADFFGLAGSYSVHFGPLVQDGRLLAMNTYTNHTYNQFATFLLDMNGNPFFNYIRHDIRFYNNGRPNVEINAYNNIGHTLEWPVIIDRLAMYDTASLNRRFDNLIKIVVDGNSIIYISEPGETVEIPQHGYVLVLPERMAYRASRFNVGDITRLVRTNNLAIDFSGIQIAIGGGGLILSNGELVNDRGIAPAGRHPRSAVGVSRDGRRLVLMTVDGRNHSVGATHAEMATLLRRYGAYNAMHFDGGGSTTLVTSTRGENHTVANTVSDGSERRVINALGVFDRSPKGEMVKISLEMNQSRAIVGMPIDGQVFGEDEFWNRTLINASDVTFIADESRGYWQDGAYTPLRPGRHTLEVRYGEYRATQTIFVYELAQLQPNRPSISLFEGQRTTVRFEGLSTDGTTVSIPAVERRRVSPTSLGHFVGDEFVATGYGAGYIAAAIGDVRVFIPVFVNGFPRSIDIHGARVAPLSAPAETVVTAQAMNLNNRRVVRMEYTFETSTHTQAAYVSFAPPLAIPGNPVGLRLQVYGDGSGHWLRARVQDNEGQNHIIDFTRSADFYGWQPVIARLPNAQGPFTIDQVYMVSLSSYETSHHQVLFSDLEALYAPTDRPVIPQNTQFQDNLRAESGFTGFQGGSTNEFGVPSQNAPAQYSTLARGDFGAITMTAYNGGIFATDSSQWRRFLRDIRAMDPEYVVILMDANPLNFHQQMEFELFHLALQELRDESRMVFVASATGDDTLLTMRDGIRYINLAQPEVGLAAIRFWTGPDGEILWGEERMANSVGPIIGPTENEEAPIIASITIRPPGIFEDDDLTITFTHVYDAIGRADIATQSMLWFYLAQNGSISFNRAIELSSMFEGGARFETIYLAAGEVLNVYGHEHLSFHYGDFPVYDHHYATSRSHAISFRVLSNQSEIPLLPSWGSDFRVSYHAINTGQVSTPSAPRILRFAIGNTTFTDNGTPHILEAAPFIQNDRTMVPLRVIIESLGATNLTFTDGVVSFVLNGEVITMAINQPLSNNMGTPVIVADRTFVPLAYIMNEIGATARWDRTARAAYVYIG